MTELVRLVRSGIGVYDLLRNDLRPDVRSKLGLSTDLSVGTQIVHQVPELRRWDEANRVHTAQAIKGTARNEKPPEPPTIVLRGFVDQLEPFPG